MRLGGLFVLMAISVVLGFWDSGSNDRFFDRVQEEIRAEVDAVRAEPTLAIAKSCHRAAYNHAYQQAPRRRKRGKAVSYSTYKAKLMELMSDEALALEPGVWLTKDDLVGSSYELVGPKQRTVVLFGSGGRYQQCWGLHDQDYISANTDMGKWSFDGEAITWVYNDKPGEDRNPMVMSSRHGFILEEKAGHCTYWRRIEEPTPSPFR